MRSIAPLLLVLAACAKNTDRTSLQLPNGEFEIDGQLSGTAISGTILFTDTEYRFTRSGYLAVTSVSTMQ